MVAAGVKVSLHPLEPGDIEFLYRWENDPAVWQYGDCGANDSSGTVPDGERFSREVLREFIENQKYGIGVTGQLRLVVCLRDPASPAAGRSTLQSVGFVDLFDLDPAELCAGVGILICDPAHRGKGYGGEALELMCDYVRRATGLRSLWCTVTTGNLASLALFSGAGFVRAAAPDGHALPGEIFLQKLLY